MDQAAMTRFGAEVGTVMVIALRKMLLHLFKVCELKHIHNTGQTIGYIHRMQP